MTQKRNSKIEALTDYTWAAVLPPGRVNCTHKSREDITPLSQP
jgi:hypothetical protein